VIDSLVCDPVAAALICTDELDKIAVMVVPAGIPVPCTGMPVTKLDVPPAIDVITFDVDVTVPVKEAVLFM
jgi:hypothetical protein